jgi:hypothetical protein
MHVYKNTSISTATGVPTLQSSPEQQQGFNAHGLPTTAAHDQYVAS